MTHNILLDDNVPSTKYTDEKADWFIRTLPFREEPYCKKTWGHRSHSLCSYQGKLKPAFAHWLIRLFVPRGGRVLDPLGGVGTIPLEAALQGFDSVSNDMSPLAHCVASAKLFRPELDCVLNRWGRIWETANSLHDDEIRYEDADFGLNGTVRDFYHPKTLREILAVRAVLLNFGHYDPEVNFIKANLLHILHGNRPYALSRISHSILPLHPKGEAEYKSVDIKLRERIARVAAATLPSSFVPGRGIHGDFRLLPSADVGKFDCIITSPPFYGMRFDRPNWLRLWFCGWGANDFHKTSLGFLERQQTKDLDCYIDFFEMCSRVLKNSGTLIMHIGSGGAKRLDLELASIAKPYFSLAYHASECVKDVANHGIKDKGLTDIHHLLFFQKS